MNLPCHYCTVHVMPLLCYIPQLSILDLAGVLKSGLRFLLFSPGGFSKTGLGDILTPSLCFLCSFSILVARDRSSKNRKHPGIYSSRGIEKPGQMLLIFISLKLNDENALFDIEAGREGKTNTYLHLVSKFEIREYTLYHASFIFTPCLIPPTYTVCR